MTRARLSFIAAAAAAGCLRPVASNSDAVHFYQLEASAPARATADPGAPSLVVTLPQARPGFDTRLMAYAPRPGELRYFAVNEWADAPFRLLQASLVRYLGETGSWGAVTPEPGAADAAYRLDIDDLVLVQEFFTKPSRVRLGFQLRLYDVASGRVIGARRFEALEKTSADDPYGGVAAADRALDEILVQVSGWLNESVRRAVGPAPL